MGESMKMSTLRLRGQAAIASVAVRAVQQSNRSADDLCSPIKCTGPIGEFELECSFPIRCCLDSRSNDRP
jgi:hypothetical protein